MTAKRKLFMTHAGELAHLLMRDSGPSGIVSRFVRSYAQRMDRRTLLQADPSHLREMESTIGREALLVMVAEVCRLEPHALVTAPRGILRDEQSAFAKAFLAEFLASTCRAIASSPAGASTETATFLRDLEIYNQWNERKPPAGALTRGPIPSESPFSDRCALLLDPPMMEAARRAAVEFEAELSAIATTRLEKLGRTEPRARTASARSVLNRATNRRRPRRHSRKIVRRGGKTARRARKSPSGRKAAQRATHRARRGKR